MKFITQYTFLQSNIDKEKQSLLPSMTIPDMSMSIPEILNRYAMGLNYNGAKIPVYNNQVDDLSLIEFGKLDLVDKHRILKERREELERLKSRINKERQQSITNQNNSITNNTDNNEQ